VKTKFNEPKKK